MKEETELLQQARVVIKAVAVGSDKEDPLVTTEHFHKAQFLASEGRGKFYDRVALLSGGAVVLSISFLFSIATKTSIHAMATLFAAWVLLLTCLLCCLFRNPPFYKYLMHSYAFYFAKSMLK